MSDIPTLVQGSKMLRVREKVGKDSRIWLGWGLQLVAIALFAAYLLFWLREKPDALVVRMPDDAFYYLKIARNFVSGYGLTFDGINLTNGFQPLWLLLLLVPAFVGHSFSPESFNRFAMVYQMVLFGIGLWLLNRAFQSHLSFLSRALMNLLAIGIGITTLIRGMEPVVLWLTFALLLTWLVRNPHFPLVPPWKWLELGIICGFVFLSRLDMIFFIILLFINLLLNTRELSILSRSQRLACWLGGFAILSAPYLLFNLLWFGDIMPISGRLKSSFPAIALVSTGVPRIPITALLAMTVGLIGSFWLQRQAHIHRGCKWVLSSWCFGSLLHCIHTALFMKWGILISHFASYWIPLTMLLPWIFQDAKAPRHRWLWGLSLAGAIIIALWAYLDVRACYRIKYTSPVHWRTSMYHAALWIRHHTPQSTVLGMTDAGIVGYYSERRVINLDGVVNNKEYQEYLRRRQLSEYIRRKRIEYLIVYVIPNLPHFPTFSRLGNRFSEVYQGTYTEFRFCYYARLYGDVPSDEIVLRHTDEVYREPHLKGMLIIWRVDPSSVSAVLSDGVGGTRARCRTATRPFNLTCAPTLLRSGFADSATTPADIEKVIHFRRAC
jgi:hypothetical protein